jgi:hypothetical protein
MYGTNATLHIILSWMKFFWWLCELCRLIWTFHPVTAAGTEGPGADEPARAHALEQREARHLETVDGLDARRQSSRTSTSRTSSRRVGACPLYVVVGRWIRSVALRTHQTIDNGDDHIRSTQTARVCAFLPSSIYTRALSSRAWFNFGSRIWIIIRFEASSG